MSYGFNYVFVKTIVFLMFVYPRPPGGNLSLLLLVFRARDHIRDYIYCGVCTFEQNNVVFSVKACRAKFSAYYSSFS